MNISQRLHTRKQEVPRYYRSRAGELLDEIQREFGAADVKGQAEAINKSIQATKDDLINTVLQKASHEQWNRDTILRTVLLLTYCCNVVMLEFRNHVWAYDYMSFSRRIGELWERFCKLCWQHPVNPDVSLFVPPLFRDVRQRLVKEITDYIDGLNLSAREKSQLKQYYDKVWTIAAAGEVKLELDVHYESGGVRVVVDLKSGFGSNEKGNTNRLLLVGSIYKNVEENYRCEMLVRSSEDENNHYLQILKRSGIWEVYCGEQAYQRILDATGFDLRKWIDTQINWEQDFDEATIEYLKQNDLTQYLRW